MRGNVVGLAAALCLITALCTGAVLAGNDRSRELTQIASLGVVAVAVLGVVLVVTR